MTTAENPAVNQLLREIDAEQIRKGAPILSVLVVHEPGNVPCSVALASIRKYKLRKPGESNGELLKRLQEEAYAWAERNPTS